MPHFGNDKERSDPRLAARSASDEAGSQYAIEPLKTEKAGIPQRAVQKKGVLPKHPFSMVISGRSGSGKTVVALNILSRPQMLKGYFHYTIVLSPTAGDTDDTYDVLDLPKENFVRDFDGDYLNDLIESRKKLIKDKGIAWVGKNSRVLLILDDIIADRSFLNSPEALKMFSLLRHYHVSIMTLMQSYNKLPRALRINANATIVFPSQQSEVEVLLDEVTPSGLHKRDFEKVIDYATDKRHSFLYINRHADPGEQIRKNLDEVIDLNDFSSRPAVVPASRGIKFGR